jgi:tetrahydromethanopterin S-methyltransferase subunit B
MKGYTLTKKGGEKMKKLATALGALGSSLLITTTVLAADPWEITVDEPTGAIPEFGPVISGGITIAISIAALLCLVYLIWGGIEWLTSGGAKEGVSAAKARMTAAFIGLMIVLAAYAIIRIVEYLFDIDITEFKFPKLVP